VAYGTLGDPVKERATLTGYLASWLDATSGTIRESTYSRYKSAVRVHVVPALGSYKLSDLKADHVQRLHSAKRAEGQSFQSVLHIHRILHLALSQAVRWGYCVRNVCDLVDKPKVPRHEMLTFTLEHARAFLSRGRHRSP
jgi:integrase